MGVCARSTIPSHYRPVSRLKTRSTIRHLLEAQRPRFQSPGASLLQSPCRLSQAASVRDGSAPTISRIICQAARLSAPSGAGPMASETEHCGQKQMRWAEDFCRGLTPVVCANTNTATDFCPASISRLQRRQYKLSKDSVSCCPQSSVPVSVSKTLPFAQVCRKIPAH